MAPENERGLFEIPLKLGRISDLWARSIVSSRRRARAAENAARVFGGALCSGEVRGVLATRAYCSAGGGMGRRDGTRGVCVQRSLWGGVARGGGVEELARVVGL